ncbi:MAG: class I SAM-dependent methyltransferase [Candidatus Heimdallarchaeota archaeon]|nr:class I SAM-dependent methyltransferase [Candidatus Heimdallarchaeota archaeon]
MKSSSQHWDAIFSGTEDSKLGWYEKDASQTLELLNHISKWKNSTVFLPGAGTSVLIEELLSKGVKLVLNDISLEALNRVKSRLGDKCKEIIWLCQDIAQPIQDKIQDVDIWIDRGVLHFLTDENDIKGYFENVKSTLKVGGYAIFAEFSKTGVSKYAGLKIHRYSIEEISENLGSSFNIVSHFEYVYKNPSGDPIPFIYALYKRDNKKPSN